MSLSTIFGRTFLSSILLDDVKEDIRNIT